MSDNGQIDVSSNLGQTISALASSNIYKNYLEIGTWKGGGSTKCFAEKILERNDAKFISLESNKVMFNQAYDLWKNKINENFILIHGRIVEANDLYTEEEILKEKDFSYQWIDWLRQDIEGLKTCKNVINDLPYILDVVLLDGGEFSSYSEFNMLLDKTNIFILDDTLALKNRRVRKNLLENPQWNCLIDRPDERQGFSVFCRKNLIR